MKLNSTSNNFLYFKHTRVPIEFLFDYLAAGKTVGDFVKSYPWIKKKEVTEVLEKLSKQLPKILNGF